MALSGRLREILVHDRPAGFQLALLSDAPERIPSALADGKLEHSDFTRTAGVGRHDSNTERGKQRQGVAPLGIRIMNISS